MFGGRKQTLEARIHAIVPTAFRVARWMLKNDADAEDAVQDATLKALKGFADVRNEDCRGWFLAIVRNECVNRLNRQRRDLELETSDEERWVAPGSIESEVYDRLTAEALWGHIDALPDAFKEVIVLREVEDMSYREISQILGVPIGTVMSRLARARAELRSRLMGDCR